MINFLCIRTQHSFHAKQHWFWLIHNNNNNDKMWLYGCYVPPPFPTIINSKFHSPVNWNAAFASFGRRENKCFALNCTTGDVREIQFRIQLGDFFVTACRFPISFSTDGIRENLACDGIWWMQFCVLNIFTWVQHLVWIHFGRQVNSRHPIWTRCEWLECPLIDRILCCNLSMMKIENQK